MKKNLQKPFYNSENDGFVLLAVVIIIAIIAIMGYFQMSNPAEPFVLPDNGPCKQPWRYQHLILDRAQLQSTEQFTEENITLKPKLFRQDTQHSQMKFIITKDGRIEGYWQDEYRIGQPTKTYYMNAVFFGNIVTEKVDSTNSSKNKGSQFFISKGKFRRIGIIKETSETLNFKGDIYVTGWIQKDGTIDGTVTLTADEKFAQHYNWTEKIYN